MADKFILNDHDAKGRGIVLCYICERPVVEHPLTEFCPFPPVANPQIPRNNGHETR